MRSDDQQPPALVLAAQWQDGLAAAAAATPPDASLVSKLRAEIRAHFGQQRALDAEAQWSASRGKDGNAGGKEVGA